MSGRNKIECETVYCFNNKYRVRTLITTIDTFDVSEELEAKRITAAKVDIEIFPMLQGFVLNSFFFH